MKYIKTYEHIDDKKLKKYAIWHMGEAYDKSYEIIRVIDEYRNLDDYQYKTKTIYVYYTDTEKLEPPNHKKNTYSFKEDGDTFHLDDSREYIHYTSNSLQDCIDIVPLIAKAKKYNL